MRQITLHLFAAVLFLGTACFVAWVAFQIGLESESALQSQQTIAALEELGAQ